jgi:hypothetical protein
MNKPSVRETITRARNKNIVFSVLNTAVAVAITASVLVSGYSPRLLVVAGVNVAALELNSSKAVRAQRALVVYKRNQAAAYIAEISHAFGDTT